MLRMMRRVMRGSEKVDLVGDGTMVKRCSEKKIPRNEREGGMFGETCTRQGSMSTSNRRGDFILQ